MSTYRIVSPTSGAGPREVWRFRELVRSLAARNLKVKYQRSALGFFWTLLNPLLTVGILILVFSYILRIQVPHYWAFLLSGFFVWNFMLQSLNTGTYILAEHSQLSRSVAFPSEVLILGAVASRLVEFAVEIVLVFLALAIVHHGGIPPSFALLPLLVLIQLLLAVGLVMPIAVLSVFYSDVQHALPIALTTLFYVSPVFYPAEMVPEAIRQFYFFNPLAGLLTLYHTVLYEGRFPSMLLLGSMGLIACAAALLGYAIFNRYKRVLVEIV